MREVHVGSVACIIPTNPPAATKDLLGQSHGVLENVVANVIQNMNAPVAHLSGPGVVIPVPVVVQFVAEQWLVLSRTEPQVVVDVLVNFQRCVTFSDGSSTSNAIDTSDFDFTECFFFVQEFLDLGLHRV